jgi:phosphate transport system protein
VREEFHGGLARLGEELSDMCLRSGQAMRQATEALLTADLALAERVLSADAELDEKRSACQEQAYGLLALQAPVARDLRVVLTAVYCAEKIERMGDLAAHVADAARFAHPEHAIPAELADQFAELGEITAGMADRVSALVVEPAEGAFEELERIDGTVDDRHAQVLATITGPKWTHSAATASQIALVARFYERFGDQSVSVARRIEFAATGTMPD